MQYLESLSGSAVLRSIFSIDSPIRGAPSQAEAAAAASSSPSISDSSQASPRTQGGHATSADQQELEWKVALHRCLAAFKADPLPSLIETASGEVEQRQSALHEFLAAAEVADTADADETEIEVEELREAVEQSQRLHKSLQPPAQLLTAARAGLQQAVNASDPLVSLESALSTRPSWLSLLLSQYVSVGTTAALSQLIRFWQGPVITMLKDSRGAFPFFALAGFSYSLEKRLQELDADVNQALSWSDDNSLLDRLVHDPQLPDQATHKSNIDMRPLCRLFSHGLDPTLITSPHTTSPLQRARERLRAMCGEQIAEVEQQLTQLTAWTALQAAAGSSSSHRDAIDEFVAFKRLHPCQFDVAWTNLWEERQQKLHLAFVIELDRQWAAHSARMRQLLLSDSTLLSFFGSFTRDLTPIICAYVGVDLERPLPDNAATDDAAADDQSTGAAESDVPVTEAQPDVEQKEGQ